MLRHWLNTLKSATCGANTCGGSSRKRAYKLYVPEPANGSTWRTNYRTRPLRPVSLEGATLTALDILLHAVGQECVATPQLVVTDAYRAGPVSQRTDHSLKDRIPVVDAVLIHPSLQCLDPMVRNLDLHPHLTEAERRIGAGLARVRIHAHECTAAVSSWPGRSPICTAKTSCHNEARGRPAIPGENWPEALDSIPP